ncbi:MAG: hypothetical protein HYR60_12250 [Acidobacteria bacterium]|nr:hypothetical protein [Acidobacteriota bacterium]
MGGFLDQAERIREIASAGDDPADVAILIGPDGAIRLVYDTDWRLESLAAHHGATTCYRVRRADGRVQVEGRCGSQILGLPSRRAAKASPGRGLTAFELDCRV